MTRLPGLDLLRATAVVWVMLFHSFLVGGLAPQLDWLSRYGWMGVDIFFVLSGFLIGRQVLAPLAAGEPLSMAAFYSRRAYRIVPAFAAVLAIYLAFPGLREAPGMAPWWQFVTFTFNLLVDYNQQQAFSHAWSLCVEEHFYLAFPALAWALTRRPSAAVFVAVCAALVATGVAMRGATWWHDTALAPGRNWFVEDLYYPTWARLDGLLAGVGLATLAVFRPGWWSRMGERGNAFLWLGVSGMGAAMWLFRERTGLLGNTLGWPLLSAAIACLVVAGCSARSAIGRWRVPGAGWIAALSYSLYLSHKLVFRAVENAVGPWLEGRPVVAFVAYAAAVLLAGAALHYTVERPFLRLRERRRTRAHHVSLAPASS